ncbi:MAG: hypothetical protein R3189_01975 [Thiomicrorhabdus chilensis]|uniref:hypothetical protein n=1 Tax=Thiomicrorhabdus chilensis TaxID=63656 RepID=UPI00299CE83D|nr:hypothetical protein [Thiomicrorhabdus chilensis]MDX1346997.1 hypothetical protein [Thiomicrorhabdus chilensis]
MSNLIRTLFLTTLFAALMPAYAENMSSMNSQGMQQMMMQMQKMQQCLQQVDENELRAYENQINQLETELKALCQAGKRDEAQSKAVEFGKQINQSKAFQQIQKCTQEMQDNDFMPSFPTLKTDEKGQPQGHICDEFE